jgi:putative DNA methylase
MFAGGGAIPLEAVRLGCEAYALDLNPVAHVIQLCTLVFPQKYGKATVPLVKQTWLCKKADRHVALKVIAPKGEKRARFEVVESRTEKGLGFDPEIGWQSPGVRLPASTA